VPSFYLVVKVVVKVLQVGTVENFNVLLDCLSQQLLSPLPHRQQIGHKYPFEVFKKTVHMHFKGFMCELKAPVDLRFGIEADLLKEYW
jgi:hypothetical protein